jgi:hypothetical protein
MVCIIDVYDVDENPPTTQPRQDGEGFATTPLFLLSNPPTERGNLLHRERRERERIVFAS